MPYFVGSAHFIHTQDMHTPGSCCECWSLAAATGCPACCACWRGQRCTSRTTTERCVLLCVCVCGIVFRLCVSKACCRLLAGAEVHSQDYNGEVCVYVCVGGGHVGLCHKQRATKRAMCEVQSVSATRSRGQPLNCPFAPGAAVAHGAQRVGQPGAAAARRPAQAAPLLCWWVRVCALCRAMPAFWLLPSSLQ